MDFIRDLEKVENRTRKEAGRMKSELEIRKIRALSTGEEILSRSLFDTYNDAKIQKIRPGPTLIDIYCNAYVLSIR